MRVRRVAALMMGLVGVLGSGCSSRACTLAGGVPVVFVDTSALAVDDPASTVVCLDDRCVPVGRSELLGGFNDDGTTAIDVIGDDAERTIEVRTADGDTLAGPTEVEIPTVYPNGEGCPGEALQGRFRVEPSGAILLDG